MVLEMDAPIKVAPKPVDGMSVSDPSSMTSPPPSKKLKQARLPFKVLSPKPVVQLASPSPNTKKRKLSDSGSGQNKAPKASKNDVNSIKSKQSGKTGDAENEVSSSSEADCASKLANKLVNKEGKSKTGLLDRFVRKPQQGEAEVSTSCVEGLVDLTAEGDTSSSVDSSVLDSVGKDNEGKQSENSESMEVTEDSNDNKENTTGANKKGTNTAAKEDVDQKLVSTAVEGKEDNDENNKHCGKQEAAADKSANSEDLEELVPANDSLLDASAADVSIVSVNDHMEEKSEDGQETPRNHRKNSSVNSGKSCESSPASSSASKRGQPPSSSKLDGNERQKKIQELKQLEKQRLKDEELAKKEEAKAEKERIRKEEKERKEKEKLELKNKKEKERLEKEEQRKKEKEEKEMQKKKEKEEKDKLKDEERKKKQDILDVRNEEKRKKDDERKKKEEEKKKIEEEDFKKKQKVQAAFQSFFTKSSKTAQPATQQTDTGSFIAFEMKKNMRLAPYSRVNADTLPLKKESLDVAMVSQDTSSLYTQELKTGSKKRLDKS